MKLFKNLFSKNSEEKNYCVQQYFGTKIKWSRISDELLTKKEAEKRAFYYSRIFPNHIFKSEFSI